MASHFSAAGGPDFERTDPKLLSLMLRMPDDPEGWRPEDLAAMLAHQLGADLATDLEAALPGSGRKLAELTTGLTPAVRTFRELLWHVAPPVEVLRLVKDFAKTGLEGPGMPRELASVLYFGSIGLALRGGVRISTLTTERLREGLQWTAQLPWMEDGMRVLLLSLMPARE